MSKFLQKKIIRKIEVFSFLMSTFITVNTLDDCGKSDKLFNDLDQNLLLSNSNRN